MATIETLILLVFVLACAPLVRYILGRQSKLVEADNVNSHVEKGTALPTASTGPPPFIPSPKPLASLTPQALDAHQARDHLFANKTIRSPYFQTMAHQPMLPEHWIEPDFRYRADLEYKAELMETQGKVVCDAMPCIVEACGEMMSLLCDWLTTRYPSLFRWQDDRKIEINNLATSKTLSLLDKEQGGRTKVGIPALQVVSQLVQDDFLIAFPSERGDGSWICAGGIVCFPGFYLLSDKIGLSLHDTHVPVPQFNEKLLKSVERSLTRLQPCAPFERTSWELVDPQDDLFWTSFAGPLPTEEGNNGAAAKPLRETHRSGRAENACQTEDPSKLLLRLDHQTFVKMPKTGAVFFGVHPMRRPLSALATMPLLPSLLLKVHRESSKDLMDYKAAPLYEASVMPYLEKLHQEQLDSRLIRGQELEDVGRAFRQRHDAIVAKGDA